MELTAEQFKSHGISPGQFDALKKSLADFAEAMRPALEALVKAIRHIVRATGEAWHEYLKTMNPKHYRIYKTTKKARTKSKIRNRFIEQFKRFLRKV